MDKVYTFLEDRAVRFLTKRKAEKLYEKSKKRTVLGEIWSWIDALIFAVIVVLIINQYLFQLFVIPSPSMVSTLNVGDRVIVSKTAYGIELYPAGKRVFTTARHVERDNIITFYNPLYDSKGPVFDVLSQVLYMGTLSLVNIDRNEDGSVAERLYVKRAAGLGGDTIRFTEGNVMIRPAGYSDFITEESFRESNGLSTGPHRSADTSLYPALKAWGRLFAYQDAGVLESSPASLRTAYEPLANASYPFDQYEFQKQNTAMAALLDPADLSKRSSAARYRAGIYVPQGYVLPLGDNRDNSQDGRYFGPVSESRINGRVVGRFWPLNRVGSMMDK